MHKYLKTSLGKVSLCLLVIGLFMTMAACGSTPSTVSTGTTPTAAPTSAPTPTPTATTAPAPTTAPTSGGKSISIANFSFSPQSVTVSVGTKVTWKNNDSVTHTVTADGGAFNSGPVSPGSSYSFTFTKAGTYAYHCSIHTSMTATIVVQ